MAPKFTPPPTQPNFPIRVIAIFITCPNCGGVVALPPGAQVPCACGARIVIDTTTLQHVQFGIEVPETPPGPRLLTPPRGLFVPGKGKPS